MAATSWIIVCAGGGSHLHAQSVTARPLAAQPAPLDPSAALSPLRPTHLLALAPVPVTDDLRALVPLPVTDPPAFARTGPNSGPEAFAIEAAGGILGAAVGYSVGLGGSDDCGENLSCALGNAATALVLGTVGAAGGAYGAGRIFGTEPNGWGAIVGSVVGAAAVVGLDHIEIFPHTDRARIIFFSLTHGTITAVGSRLGAAWL